MGLKKNILYSGFLTTGLYLSQLVTYPYVTRTLGAENLGTCNFMQSFVQFFLLFSALGISTLGVREIAKSNNDKEKLNNTFSRLFLLTGVITLISLLCYLIIGLLLPQFSSHYKLFWIGAFNILFSLFSIEWLYRGIEDFKYITYRTLILRIVYILLIFLLVKNETHYVRYYFLSMVVVVINSLINWFHSRKMIKFRFYSIKDIGNLWKSDVLMGGQLVLLSYNSTINPMLLGLFGNNTEVGYFTTASKLILIVLLFYNAYTLVVLPRVSSMIGNNLNRNAQVLVDKSYLLLYMLAIPIIILTEIYVPEIIYFIAGAGYEGAILPMRIALPVILVGGISQITINQVLIPNNLEKGSMLASAAGVLSCLLCSCFLISKYQSAASAISWLIAEIVITTITLVYANRHLNGFSAKLLVLIKYTVIFLPLLLLFFIKINIDSMILQIGISIVIAIIYIHFTMSYCVHDENYISIVRKMVKKKG